MDYAMFGVDFSNGTITPKYHNTKHDNITYENKKFKARHVLHLFSFLKLSKKEPFLRLKNYFIKEISDNINI